MPRSPLSALPSQRLAATIAIALMLGACNKPAPTTTAAATPAASEQPAASAQATAPA